MNMVMLKTGGVVPESTATATMEALKFLAISDPYSLVGFINLCKGLSHRLWASSGESLIEGGLLESDMSVQYDIREITLAAIEQEGSQLRLVSPYHETPAFDNIILATARRMFEVSL